MHHRLTSALDRRRARAWQDYQSATPGTGYAFARRAANLQSALLAVLTGEATHALPAGLSPIALP